MTRRGQRLRRKRGTEAHDLLTIWRNVPVPKRTLSKIRGEQTKEPNQATVQAILSGLPLLDGAGPDTVLGCRKEVPNTTLALVLRVAHGDTEDGPPTEDELVYIREVKSG
jgi:hypothetical protein